MEEEESLGKRIFLLARVAVSLALTLLGVLLFTEDRYGLWVNLAIMAVAAIIVSYDVFMEAIETIFKEKNPFDEHVLMVVAVIGAFCLRLFGSEHNEFFEGVMVMMLYQVGEFFQDLAADKSKEAITKAIDLRDQKANVILADGSFVKKTPEELSVGDVCLFKVGEKALCDGEVIEGEGEMDESSLTGEYLPVSKHVGSEIYSGTTLQSGSIKVRVSKEYKDSAVKKLLDLVENSAEKKGKTDRFITRFSRVYTPIVMGLALLVALIPPLFLGISDGAVWSRWIYAGLCFLVISCPCAIVISVPLAFFSGLGLAAKNGIVIKGGEYLDALNSLGYVCFDKTGTLTEGRLKVERIETEKGVSKEDFMDYLLAAESRSNHPLARAIIGERDVSAYSNEISEYEEIAGFGVRLVYKGHKVVAGKLGLLKEGVAEKERKLTGTIIEVAVDDKFLGFVELEDTIRPTSKDMVMGLRQMGVKSVLLSGDRVESVENVAKKLSLDEFHGGLHPEDKTKILQSKLNAKEGAVAFVGDGINDAPSIALSDVGVAMGAFGSDLAIENADVVLMDDDPAKIITAKKIARSTENRALFNIIVALISKVAAMVLSIAWAGFPLWLAVLLDSGMAVILVFSSLLLFAKKVR